MCGALVDSVVGIGLKLGPLPLALAGELTVGRRTEGLIGNLRPGSKELLQQAQRLIIVVGSMQNPHGCHDRITAAGRLLRLDQVDRHLAVDAGCG